MAAPRSENTVHRWITHGVRGIKLDVIRVGVTIYTSREATAHWLDRINSPQARRIGGLTARR